jgi:hypothetical protein
MHYPVVDDSQVLPKTAEEILGPYLLPEVTYHPELIVSPAKANKRHLQQQMWLGHELTGGALRFAELARQNPRFFYTLLIRAMTASEDSNEPITFKLNVPVKAIDLIEAPPTKELHEDR